MADVQLQKIDDVQAQGVQAQVAQTLQDRPVGLLHCIWFYGMTVQRLDCVV